MFLGLPRSHFLPSSRQPGINLARKDTATVFQKLYALCEKKFKTRPLNNGNLKKTKKTKKKLKRAFVYV